MSTAPFGSVEMALTEILKEGLGLTDAEIGGDLRYPGTGRYYYLELIGGQTDRLYGTWSVDIDIFARTYAQAMGAALDLEAFLVGRQHRSAGMLIDQCSQNEAPSQRPWRENKVARVGATYVFTARRSR